MKARKCISCVILPGSMDVATIVLYAILQAALSACLGYVASALVRCATYKVDVASQEGKDRVRDLLLKSRAGPLGSCEFIGGRLNPGIGWHLVFVRRWWPVLIALERTRTERFALDACVVYALTRACVAELIGSAAAAGSPGRLICVTAYEKVTPYLADTSQWWHALPGDSPTEEQARACTLIERSLRSSRYESCSALLLGPHGCGKTSTPYFLAQALSRSGREPRVIVGFDPAIKGARLGEVIPNAIEGRTVLILVLEELDKAFEFAERNTASATDFTCLAQTKASLNRFLDTLATKQNLIVIATTNCTLEDLRARKLEGYVRSGRFSLHVEYSRPVV